MATIVYDTGALLAAERRNPDFLALHDELTAARIRPIVPVVVLAQALRDGPQHQISRVLKACDILPDDQHLGRAAGVACAAASTSDVVDAIVDAIRRSDRRTRKRTPALLTGCGGSAPNRSPRARSQA